MSKLIIKNYEQPNVAQPVPQRTSKRRIQYLQFLFKNGYLIYFKYPTQDEWHLDCTEPNDLTVEYRIIDKHNMTYREAPVSIPANGYDQPRNIPILHIELPSMPNMVI